MMSASRLSVIGVKRLCFPSLLVFVFSASVLSQDQAGAIAGNIAKRTWTDSTGKFKVESQLLNVVDNSARLRKTNGKEITLSVDRLSPEDQSFIQSDC